MQTTIDFHINNTKPPTTRDVAIFEYLKAGNKIDHVKALQLFNTTGLRDSIYRLRKAEYKIESRTIYYKNDSGENKKYREYFVKE